MPTLRTQMSWGDIHYSAVEVRSHVARTEKECAACPEPILPGQRYAHIVWTFPWTQIADDVDDEGRAIGSPAGEWLTSNTHHDCIKEDR